jgi:hypothetical protein
MLARVGDRKTDLPRQLFDCSIPIAEDIDNLNSAPACQRLGNPSELVEELHFDSAIRHCPGLWPMFGALSAIQLISL